MNGVQICNIAQNEDYTEHWDTTNVFLSYRNADIAAPCQFSESLGFTKYVQPNLQRYTLQTTEITQPLLNRRVTQERQGNSARTV